MQLQRERDFRQIRLICGCLSVGLLALHLYFTCYRAFEYLHWTHPLINRVVRNLVRSGFITRTGWVKGGAIVLLFFSRLGLSSGGFVSTRRLILLTTAGSLLFFGSGWLVAADLSAAHLAAGYVSATVVGFFLLYQAFIATYGLLGQISGRDVFNRINESFPQQEKLIRTAYSVNLPGRYRLRNTTRKMWVNDANVFRGSLCLGLPGSGKTRYFFGLPSFN